MSQINPKQKKFADEYIISGNGADAYVKAGYSGKFPRQNAKNLLNVKAVSDYIKERMNELEGPKIAKQEEVLTYLTSVLRGEAKEQVLIGVGQGMQEIAEITPSSKDRIKAAELLGKFYGIWVNKQEVDLNVPVIFEGADDVPD